MDNIDVNLLRNNKFDEPTAIDLLQILPLVSDYRFTSPDIGC